MTRLTLAMIVKDEADILPGFFAHHAGLFDAMVVVDTGSTDGSAEICRSQGCQLLERAWTDDFAAARNAGLSEIPAGWILILDADERIGPGDFAGLKAVAGTPADRVLLQETRNYTGNRQHLEWQPVTGRDPAMEAGQTGFFAARRAGLFPARPDLRFQGRIHESVLPQAAALGLPVRACPVPVHHYGYVRSAEINRARQARYLDLARRKAADAPGDPAALLELATALLESGAAAEAEGVLETLVTGEAGLRPVVRGHFLLGRLLREKGNLPAAEDLLSRGLDQDPGFRFTRLELVRVQADQERWSSVNMLLAGARDHFGPEDPLFMREDLRLRVKTGQLKEARRLAGRLVEICPEWTEIAGLKLKLDAMTGG